MCFRLEHGDRGRSDKRESRTPSYAGTESSRPSTTQTCYWLAPLYAGRTEPARWSGAVEDVEDADIAATAADDAERTST
jgi:hypothetical protein